jgi:hypothetical protein
MSQVGPTTSVRTTTGTGGVAVGGTNLSGGLEDPLGNAAPVPAPGNDNASPVSDDMPPSLVPAGEKGFHGSRMDELGERAGVNVGHIHHYFESKEAKK